MEVRINGTNYESREILNRYFSEDEKDYEGDQLLQASVLGPCDISTSAIVHDCLYDLNHIMLLRYGILRHIEKYPDSEDEREYLTTLLKKEDECCEKLMDYNVDVSEYLNNSLVQKRIREALERVHLDAARAKPIQDDSVCNSEKPNLKIFAYSVDRGSFSSYGITCGIIIAESFEEAKKEALKRRTYKHQVTIREIPFKKGYTEIGSYSDDVF